jgi:hypothetical protein
MKLYKKKRKENIIKKLKIFKFYSIYNIIYKSYNIMFEKNILPLPNIHEKYKIIDKSFYTNNTQIIRPYNAYKCISFKNLDFHNNLSKKYKKKYLINKKYEKYINNNIQKNNINNIIENIENIKKQNIKNIKNNIYYKKYNLTNIYIIKKNNI